MNLLCNLISVNKVCVCNAVVHDFGEIWEEKKEDFQILF